MRVLKKKPSPEVYVNMIKKGPPVDPPSSSLFGTMDGGMKDKDKGTLCCSVWFGCCIPFLTIALTQVHWISMIYSMTMVMMSC